jgi:hypothetical protein
MGFFDRDTGHFVAIYGYNEDGWNELDRAVFTSCAEYVGAHSLTQVDVEPSHVWLALDSGTGAHSGCYDLLSFDGETLRLEAANWNSSPGAGFLQDLDGDGAAEVILNKTENYVFCYACGVRLPSFEVLRWDGTQLVEVELEPLPESAPADVRRYNDRAVELAQALLWQDALVTLTEAQSLDMQDPALASTVDWNAEFIRLHNEATTGPYIYPLLENTFHGDYAAAVDAMRPYTMTEIWGPESPLVVGTPAEGWELELSNWISWTTNMALEVMPNLAPAYFLRGWGIHLRSPGDPAAVDDVERAAELDPDDSLFAESAAHLQVPISTGPPAEAIDFQPLAPGECYALGQAMVKTLQVTVTQSSALFEDYIHGGKGTGCQSVANGTGADFGNLGSVIGSLGSMLDDFGWAEDAFYAAGGPNGTASAYRQDDELCLLNVGWVPAPDVDCPSDEPISACEMAPEQQLYTIALNCAQGAASIVPQAATPAASAAATPGSQLEATPNPDAALESVERWEVRSFLVGPGNPGRLYALLTDESMAAWPAMRAELIVSDDSGETWSSFSGGLPAPDCIRNVNLDYAVQDALLASTCQGLFQWTGSEWILVSPEETGIVAVAYGDPDTMWATGAYAQGAAVLRSDDGGDTWTPAGRGLINFNGVANLGIDPRDPNTLYAIIWPKYAGSYLRRGSALGEWQTMPTPMENTTIGTGLTIDGRSGDLYIIAWDWQDGSYELWRTSNPSVPDVNDVEWEWIHDFGPDVQVELLASGSLPDGLVLYANIWPVRHLGGSTVDIGPGVVHQSLDGGRTWTPLAVPLPASGES